MKYGTEGWIYVMVSEDHKYFKVGKAHPGNYEKRANHLKLLLPFKIGWVEHNWVIDRHQAERDLHEYFRSKHINGEWFALDFEPDLEYIERFCEAETDTYCATRFPEQLARFKEISAQWQCQS